MRVHTGRLFVVLAVGACLLVASVASGDISDTVFTIQATNAAGSGVYEVPFEEGTYDPEAGTFTWHLATPVPILTGGGLEIAELKGGTLSLRTDPQINLGFVVQAGATDTMFVITSALLSFPTIPASVAEGRASAAFSVTDLTGDGVTLAGLGTPGAGAYTAQYNGFVPTGTTFSNLVALVQAGPGGSGGGSQNDPPFGYRPIGEDVSDMSASIGFTLTAGDMASGTTNYEILPEPASIGLVLMGALALIRPRR